MAFHSGITVAPSRPAASSRTCAALRELGGCPDRERDQLRVPRRARVHPDLAVGQIGRRGGRLLSVPRLLGRRRDDDGRSDAEGERDGGERSAGAGLVAGEVAHCQPRGDRRAAGRPGKDADRQRAQEQRAEDRREDSGDDERLAGSVGEREAADSSGDQQGGEDWPNGVRASAWAVAPRGRA